MNRFHEAMTVNNFTCPKCGRLCSVPWQAAWCPHHDTNFQAHPPSWVDNDWTRMVPVEAVEMGALPVGADEWYVQEMRNRFGYPNDTIPGDDKRSARIVAGPMAREEAYADAKRRPRDPGVESHIHVFRAVPGDLTYESDDDD